MERFDTDFLIVGSGLAGLCSALSASAHGSVTLLTNSKAGSGNSSRAQGGIATAVSSEDSPEIHAEDTIEAGRGLCNREAVSALTQHALEAVRWLEEMGVRFDRGEGGLLLGREGGHRRRRILHSGGSATGRSLTSALTRRVRQTPAIRVLEHTTACELLADGEQCYGVRFERQGSAGWIVSPRTILATGGAASLYERTTNPASATGDGIGLAYFAGAEIMDMEFMQFHPTALYSPTGSTFLISEAVRGEGAYLLNAAGRRFMPQVHEMAELAPRDVVAAAIHREMRESGSEYVFLGAQHLPAAMIRQWFPNIFAACLEHGLDMTRDRLPVAPAAHYTIGGVRTDLDGRTSVGGLLACGEAACTGLHGANRLAGNSLLECVVFARRAVEAARKTAAPRGSAPAPNQAALPVEAERDGFREVARLLTGQVGLMRTGDGLASARKQLDSLWEACQHTSWHWRNRLQVARLITEAALMRMESRGVHRREDFPHEAPDGATHIVFQKDRVAQQIEERMNVGV